MKILLTGSGGFIGKNIIEQIGNKYNFITPRSRELNLLDENAVHDFIKHNTPDLIIHSAAAGVRITPNATREQVAIPNIKMFDNLARHVSRKCQMIVFGSGAEYDKSRPLVSVPESEFGASEPNDPYGYSKYMISKKIESMDNVLNMRIFGIYGKYENPTRFTSYAISQNIAHKPIEINQNVVFQFLYINDFCKIMDWFIKNPITERFVNICPDDKITLTQLSEIVNKNSDYKSEIIVKNSGLNNEYTGNNSKLHNIMPNVQFTSYSDGLRQFADFMQHIH